MITHEDDDLTNVEDLKEHNSRNTTNYKSALVTNAIEKIEIKEWRQETIMTPQE